MQKQKEGRASETAVENELVFLQHKLNPLHKKSAFRTPKLKIGEMTPTMALQEKFHF